MPQIAKSVANRSGGMERSCNYLLRISQNTKKKVLKRKVILNIAIQHRDALFLACFVGVALVTGRGDSINFAAIFLLSM